MWPVFRKKPIYDRTACALFTAGEKLKGRPLLDSEKEGMVQAFQDAKVETFSGRVQHAFHWLMREENEAADRERRHTFSQIEHKLQELKALVGHQH